MSHAPLELSSLGLDPSRFVRADNRSWRGSCPRCGGHRRLLVFTDHPFPKWHVRCDGCGFKAWADELNTALKQPISDAIRFEWANRNTREQAERQAYRVQRLAEFTTAELWEEYHARMADAQREWWESQGIPREWQEYYCMGYVPSKMFKHDGSAFESPAYTIPIFDVGRLAINMQYRLVNPPDGVGRYRQEYGLPAAAFLSNPDDPIGDEVIVVEGAKKAAVTQIYLDRSPLVIGVPGARSWAGVPERVHDCGRVWVMLDPDAQAAALDMAKAIGKAARIVSLPCKPDDLMLQYGATAEDIRRAMKEARA